MPNYRVNFLNEIPRNEQLFHCCQRSIIIRSAPNAERAVEVAKKQFAGLEGIRDWKIHAALIEIETIDLEATPEKTPSRREARVAHKAALQMLPVLDGGSRP
jgi:hypothetical protein